MAKDKGKRVPSAVSTKEPAGHIPISHQETEEETNWNTLKLLTSCALFGIICMQLETLEVLSEPVLLYMTKIRTSFINSFLKLMGFFGFEFFFILIPITCFAVSLNNNRRKLSFGFDLILLLIYTWIIGSLIKSVFARLRPYQLFDDIYTPDDMAVLEYSFPSGHSCGSMICWTFLYDRLKVGKSKQQKFLIYIATWIVVSLASGSRIYFCVHFPHDVFAGWILSFILYRLYSDWNVLPSVRAIIGLCGIMFVTCVFSSLELLLHMPGLVTCTASLTGVLFCLSFSKYLPKTSPLVNRPIPPSPIWKKASRVIIGTLFFTITGALKEVLASSVMFLFATGFTMMVWLLWLAPALFTILHLY